MDEEKEKSLLTRWADNKDERCGNCKYYQKGLDVGSCKLSNFIVNESKNCDYFTKK